MTSSNLFIVLVFLLFSKTNLFAQTFNTKTTLCDACEKELSVKFESTSFFKNNEYNNQFTKGFTGIGYFVKPTLQYYFTKNTKVNAGVYLQQYAGKNQLHQVIPIFSVHQQFNKNWAVVFGSLYGSLNHQLKEPLFRFDNYYQNNVEYGLQALYNASFVKSDLWLQWDQFIFNNDPKQEEFQAGSVSEFKVFENKQLKINIPLQLLVYHKGGQIDASTNPIVTLFNGNSGLQLTHLIKEKNSIIFEGLFFWYKGLALPESGINSQLYKSGTAWYVTLKHHIKRINYSLGYWQAKKFIAPKGEYLFLSISENDRTFTEAKRKLITTKFAYTHQLSKQVKIEARADGYYDLINNRFDYSYGLYLLLNEDFFIKKLKVRSALSKNNKPTEYNYHKN